MEYNDNHLIYNQCKNYKAVIKAIFLLIFPDYNFQIRLDDVLKKRTNIHSISQSFDHVKH